MKHLLLSFEWHDCGPHKPLPAAPSIPYRSKMLRGSSDRLVADSSVEEQNEQLKLIQIANSVTQSRKFSSNVVRPNGKKQPLNLKYAYLSLYTR